MDEEERSQWVYVWRETICDGQFDGFDRRVLVFIHDGFDQFCVSTRSMT